MCLFPGSAGRMAQPIIPPTAKAAQLKKMVCATSILQLIFAIMVIVFDPYDGINEMLMAMILACAAQQLHFCYLMFYLMMALFSLVYYISFVGLSIQNIYYTQQDVPDFMDYYHTDTYYSYEMTVSIMMIVFLIIAIIIAFLAYREFKAIFYEQVGLGGSLVPRYGQPPDNQPQRGNQPRQQQQYQQQNSYQYYQGQPINADGSNNNQVYQGMPVQNQQQRSNQQPPSGGGAGGGFNNQPRTLNQSTSNQNQQQSSSSNTSQNNKGGFKAFAGQGVRLGGGDQPASQPNSQNNRQQQ